MSEFETNIAILDLDHNQRERARFFPLLKTIHSGDRMLLIGTRGRIELGLQTQVLRLRPFDFSEQSTRLAREAALNGGSYWAYKSPELLEI